MTAPALIGIPYDESSSFCRGSAEAPPIIRQALFSSASNLWSEKLIDLGKPGVFEDAGDLAFTSGMDIHEEIHMAITRLLDAGQLPLVLGGDHSITYPILRAMSRAYPRLSLLQIDAHPDLYEEYQGNRFSHACPFARIMEKGWVAQLVQVGVRTMNKHQQEQAGRFGVEVITMASWEAGRRFDLDGPVYVSIDLDAFDPAFAPGVSHREPGGFSVRDVLSVIQDLAVPMAGADIVEFNPRRDPVGLTALVCAKLVKELMSKMLIYPTSIEAKQEEENRQDGI
jgi:agmatinase